MNIVEFMRNIESVYGKYDSGKIKALVIAFISQKWPEKELENLYADTLKQFSTQYKTQPDVAFFNDLWENENQLFIENKAEIAWLLLENELKSDRSILCTDLAMQETIISMGGINIFISYRSDEHNWCHRRFIELYSKFCKSQDLKNISHKIIKSQAQINYPKYPPERFYEDVKIIGDEKQGKIMITEFIKIPGIEYKQKNEIPFKHGKEVFQIPEVKS